MQDLIVLGIIPGTDIQLNFNDWLLLTIGLLLAYKAASYMLKHAHKLQVPLTSRTAHGIAGQIGAEEITV